MQYLVCSVSCSLTVPLSACPAVWSSPAAASNLALAWLHWRAGIRPTWRLRVDSCWWRRWRLCCGSALCTPEAQDRVYHPWRQACWFGSDRQNKVAPSHPIWFPRNIRSTHLSSPADVIAVSGRVVSCRRREICSVCHWMSWLVCTP